MAEGQPNIYDEVIGRLTGTGSTYGYTPAAREMDMRLLEARLKDPNVPLAEKAQLRAILGSAKRELEAGKMAAPPPGAPTPKPPPATPAPTPKPASTIPPEFAPPPAIPAPKPAPAARVRQALAPKPTPKPTPIPAPEEEVAKAPAIPDQMPPDPFEKLKKQEAPAEKGTWVSDLKGKLGATIPSMEGSAPAAPAAVPTATPPPQDDFLGNFLGRMKGETLYPSLKPGPNGSFYASEPKYGAKQEKKTTESEFVSPPKLQSSVEGSMSAQETAAENYRKAIAAYYGTEGEPGKESPYASDLAAKEKSRKEAYDQFLSRMDGAQKAEMWDKIIGALGKITAGTVGLKGLSGVPGLPKIPAGLNVAGAYQYTPSVDRGQLEASAAKLREAQEGRADEVFQMAKSKRLEPQQAAFLASLPPEQQMKFWDMYGKYAGGKTRATETGTGEEFGVGGRVITPSQYYPSAKSSKKEGEDVKFIQGKIDEDKFQTDVNAIRTNHTKVSTNFPPNAAGLNDAQYIKQRSGLGADAKQPSVLPRQFIEGLLKHYKATAKTPADAYRATDEAILRILTVTNMSPESEEYDAWYGAVEAEEKKAGGVQSGLRGLVPTHREQHGGRFVPQFDPNSNPNSWRNQNKNSKQPQTK